MPARRIAMLLAACALGAPASASAATAPDTGGAAAPPPDAPLLAPRGVLVGETATFKGTLGTRYAGRTVRIERLDARKDAWVEVASATVGADGTYAARWTADVAGRMRVHLVLGDRATAAMSGPSPEAGVTVYRPAVASWYGPGFYGRRTACGKRMTKRLLGVAHRTLPCGTPVELAYGGATITVPVVDRGPFKKGRRWDLTAATAKALGFTFTDTIGAVRVG
jgi:peptidoglycan lytic transglycosylase